MNEHREEMDRCERLMNKFARQPNHETIDVIEMLTCIKRLLAISRKYAHELESIYMLARLKRVITHHYPEGFPDVPAERIGPKSGDIDWDSVIRFCEQAGLKSSIIREA